MEWSTDLGPAAWIQSRLSDFLEARVTSIVPQGFPSYARLLHPILIGDQSGARSLRWAHVAKRNNATLERGAPFERLLSAEGDSDIEVRPVEGSLSATYAEPLIEILARHTPHERYWFALWDGYGWQRESRVIPAEVLAGPRLHLPYRTYFLYSGALDDALAFMAVSDQTPNLWWPESHDWMVATDIDLPFTYVGGSASLVDELLGSTLLEAEPAYPDDTRVSPTQK